MIRVITTATIVAALTASIIACGLNLKHKAEDYAAAKIAEAEIIDGLTDITELARHPLNVSELYDLYGSPLPSLPLYAVAPEAP